MSKLGPNLDQAWSKLGPSLVQTWSKLGPNLDQAWSKLGPSLDKLGQAWSKLGLAYWLLAGWLVGWLGEQRPTPGLRYGGWAARVNPITGMVGVRHAGSRGGWKFEGVLSTAKGDGSNLSCS